MWWDSYGTNSKCIGGTKGSVGSSTVDIASENRHSHLFYIDSNNNNIYNNNNNNNQIYGFTGFSAQGQNRRFCPYIRKYGSGKISILESLWLLLPLYLYLFSLKCIHYAKTTNITITKINDTKKTATKSRVCLTEIPLGYIGRDVKYILTFRFLAFPVKSR